MSFLFMCAGKDLNLRSPKATDLQSVVIDHSTTGAWHSLYTIFIYFATAAFSVRIADMKKMPLSYIELSKENLIHNLKSLQGVAKKGTKFALAVKGNAYGHGQNEIVKIAEPYADYFLVNSIEELRGLRKVSKKQVFLFGYVAPMDISEAIKLGCIFGTFSLEQFESIQNEAKKLGKKQEVHIACDALLGREGFLTGQLPELFALAKKSSSVKITGMYAHFANIEDTNNFTHAEKQIKAYEKMVAIAKKNGYKNLQTHISATSGLLVYEKNKGINTIVRIGIGMYGLWPSEHIEFLFNKKGLELHPVLSWKTHIAQVKTLPAGATIGYGLTYMTHIPTRIALIPQGYADGLGRNLSNRGEVLISGVRCSVLGRIAMNMFVVDVTHLDGVSQNDEVVIIGTQGKEEITADDVAEKIGSINYEIVTRISPLLPRIVK